MSRNILTTTLVLTLLSVPQFASAVHHVTVRQNDEQIEIAGSPLVEATDGGILLKSRDTSLWTLQPDDIVHRHEDDQPFEPMPRDELQEFILKQLPDGFQVHRTAHYLVCYNTSRAYAQWCGALYERLYFGFFNYWRKRGLPLYDPETHLVAIVFDNKSDYQRFSADELGEATPMVLGYYSQKTNRMTMYDLTGVEGVRGGGRPSTSQKINQVLSQPAAIPNVATIIHEATHQLAFNCGLQTRYGVNPLWLAEGLAMYFETPDLQNSKGWGTIGQVNYPRLQRLQRYVRQRPANSLKTLLVNDDRLRNGRTALDAYAESWGLCYYLIQRRPKEFAAYLHDLAERTPLQEDTPTDRLVTFQKHFGHDIEALDRQMLDYLGNQR